MKIMRIDSDKEINQVVTMLDIELDNGQRFRLNESHGELRVHESDGNKISITPCCSNEILISSFD